MDERNIVAIDLGTSKFAVTVAAVEGDNMEVIYYREHPSDGVVQSRVRNPHKASIKLKEAINEAEEELGVKISHVVVGMPRYEVTQDMGKMVVERDPRECITYEEIRNLKEMAMDTYPLEDQRREILLDAVAQSFSNDEEFQIVEDDIIGMASDKIEGNFKIFIGKAKPLEDINIAFDKIGVVVARKYFTPDSTAKAVLRDSEMDNGVALIDFGAGVTSVSIYSGGIMRHYASIPFGGNLITKDIKSEASISYSLAENIKLAYGACMPDKLQNLSEKVLYINSESSAPSKQLSVKYLSEIITARVKEIVNAVLYEIEQSGFADNLKSGIVITGGGANLTNCGNLVKEMSGYNVRTGYPRQTFSASSCDGIYDTGAATSIGMLLNAKADAMLNCCRPEDAVQEMPAAETVMEEEPVKDLDGQLGFGGDFIPSDEEKRFAEEKKKQEEEERKKKQKEAKNRGQKGITWFNRFGKKIRNGVGDLYESITQDINKEGV